MSKDIVIIALRPLDTLPIYRLHLPDYNEAAWDIEGKDLYPQFEDYAEYRETLESRPPTRREWDE